MVDINERDFILNKIVKSNVSLFSKDNKINQQHKINTIDNIGMTPSPRFGHSLTLINASNAILFGGAVGDIDSCIFSNETFIYNLMTRIWMNLINISSELPMPRAAHAAVSNDNSQLIIHGGSFNMSELAEDELWLCELINKEESTWKYIPTLGQSPGKRYGHTLTFVKPYFVLFGGNLNYKVSNDLWIITFDKLPISWVKIDFEGKPQPQPRIYHSCGLLLKGTGSSGSRSNPGLILFGGRSNKDKPLNDLWELKRNKEGIWEWFPGIITKGNQFQARYHHSITFYGPLMVILGGRTSILQDPLPLEVYDTESYSTYQFVGIGLHRQIALIKDTSIYVYGGFQNSNSVKPLNAISILDLSSIFNGSLLHDKFTQLVKEDKQQQQLEKVNKIIIKSVDNNRISNININNSSNNNNIINSTSNSNNVNTNNTQSSQSNTASLLLPPSLLKKEPTKESLMRTSKTPTKFKLANQVVVGKVASDDMTADDSSNLFRKISIDKLPEETKRIGLDKVTSLLQNKRIYNEEVIDKFINTLLRPNDWFSPEVIEIHKELPFTNDEIDTLIREVKPLIAREPSLIRTRSPCKIFGNLYGQYNDLMNFFQSYKFPSDNHQNGDINVCQYIFLGDFIDRGFYSLEVLFLLLALKVKYPNYIHLIRGHHEDISINAIHGFGEECKERLSSMISKENSVFMKLNSLFEYLPLAILINNQILCVHGGIGSSIHSLSDIEEIKRPIQVFQEVTKPEHQVLIDLLWSEYADEVYNIEINKERDLTKSGFIVKYGRERLNKFLSDNSLNLLITSHQWIKEGIKSYNNDKIFIVFSATDYMDKFGNLGGMLIIGKKNANRPVQISPKLLSVFERKKPSYQVNKKESPIRQYKSSK